MFRRSEDTRVVQHQKAMDQIPERRSPDHIIEQYCLQILVPVRKLVCRKVYAEIAGTNPPTHTILHSNEEKYHREDYDDD